MYILNICCRAVISTGWGSVCGSANAMLAKHIIKKYKA